MSSDPSDQSFTLTSHRVTVIGAGTMGHGIAGQAARCGAEVILFDTSPEALSRGKAFIDKSYQVAIKKGKMTAQEVDAASARLTLADLDVPNALQQACTASTIVIEAAPEQLALKRSIFAEVEAVVSPTTLLATNTSSLSIDQIAAEMSHPERFIGMHFFNPVAIMPLLELVRGSHTSEDSILLSRQIAEALLKTPIVVKDSPGFATSRLGIALGNEAMRIFEEGVASAKDIDQAMVLGYRHPIGPLALTDLVGLDVRLAISEYLHSQLQTDTFAPPQILRDKVAKGELGKKSGRGFYEY